ncbi:MAG: hypothetical protein IKK62_12755 [Bacteroidaceae bacterium]|nr:hypothetical protein [Bacteroidaceae bacterium]
MRRTKYFILQIVLVCLALCSCQDVEEPVYNVPSPYTCSAENVSVTTAYLTGELYGGLYHYGDYYYNENYFVRKEFLISKSKTFTNCIRVNAGHEGGNTYYAKVERLDEGTTYYYKFKVTNIGVSDSDIVLEGAVKEFTTKEKGKAVDLGLSIKWADRNVGADSSEGYGDYFAWGEIYTKDSYTEENSETYNRDIGDIAGHFKRDVAYADWGENWRLPSREECKELINKCTWTWTTQGGHKGYKVVGPNGKSIFLPATGLKEDNFTYNIGEKGIYWTSQPYLYNDDYISAYCFGFDVYDDNVPKTYWSYRHYGRSIRPVCE